MTLRSARAPARPSRVRRTVFALVLALSTSVLASVPTPATVYTRFDFETPSYGGFGRRLADHMLLKNAGVWHLFYTELSGAATPVDRIGHASSTDLVHWTERPTVIAAGDPGWTQSGTWAPHVVPAPSGGWVLLFAGQNVAGSEVILAMTSGDLDNWQLAPNNPVFIPSTTWARWGPDFACSCRDPFLYYENGAWSMLYTVDTQAPPRPAIGRAESLDLLNWTDMGAFAIDSVSTYPADLESPSLVVAGGRAELMFTRTNSQILLAPNSAGPWDFAQMTDLDAKAGACEVTLDGNLRLLSRVRFDLCTTGTTVILIDTVTTSPTGYNVPGPPGLPLGWTFDGDAFSAQPVYSDGPLLRGATPALPEGFRWLGSGETLRQPGESPYCNTTENFARAGYVSSPRFTLLGDLLSFRLMGKNSIDSTYVALYDDCTGQELSRTAAPGTNTLTPFSWSNAGRRGWPVRLRLTDLSKSPGGVVGLDAVMDSAVGSPAPPVQPLIDETAPAGGENLAPNNNYTIRYTGSSPAGLDSFVVYVSYDDFATAPQRITKRNANQFTYSWDVPSGPKYNVKIRIVVYAKNGVHACDQSGAFTIGVTTGVEPGPTAGPEVVLSARAQPGPAPVLEWRAPEDRRASLALYDVRGRRIRLLYDGPGARAGRVVWDGRDDAGRIAPSGLYFARLTSGAERVVAHVVRVGH